MLNLVVLRSKDIERAAIFYQALGLSFSCHSHGNGPEHYSAELGSLVFEIYPISEKSGSSEGTRIGFSVSNIDSVFGELVSMGANSDLAAILASQLRYGFESDFNPIASGNFGLVSNLSE